MRQRIERACASAQRSTDDVTLVAVTKFFPAEDVVRLFELGVMHVGESRDQEAAAKITGLPSEIWRQLTVHFIGQLQSNKAGHVASYADVVQVDRPKIAASLARAAGNRAELLSVLVQVDLSGIVGRGGVAPEAAAELADEVNRYDDLRLRGVMAVAPLEVDPTPAFVRLATLAAVIRTKHPAATWISAGMSADLEQAVHAGATHLRVGSAILGSRPMHR